MSQRHSQSAAQVLGLLARAAQVKEGLLLDEAMARFGLDMAGLIRLQRQVLDPVEELGPQGLDLGLQFGRINGHTVLTAHAPRLLAVLTRLPLDEARLARLGLLQLACRPELRSPLQRLTRRLSHEAGENFEHPLLRRGATLPPRRRQTLARLLEAQQSRRVVRLGYKASPLSRVVWPLSTRPDAGVWRLLAFDPAPGKGLRTFRLEGLHDLRVLDEHFAWPSHLGSPQELRAYDLSVYQSGAADVLVKVKVRGDAAQAFGLAAPRGGGWRVMSLKSTSPAWVARQALTQWPNAQVLAPPEFKQAWMDEVEGVRQGLEGE